MTDKTIPFSALDLAPIPEGASAKEAFTHSLDLARLAEKRGYHRYWLAEHHNMTGIASAATSVLIGYLAANTTTLHLGSGGVMLPNHSPLVIAEQFGTLNTLYPGRIDLGLGRAPGSDQPTMRALRRHMSGDIDNFPRDVAELVDWFDARDPNPHVRPVPGYGEQVPVWLLGSSLYSAQLAAQLGLPFAFASHFAPDMLFQALHLYRTQFKPSARLEKPYAMVCINIIAADSNRDAEFLFTSMQQAFVKLRRGETGQLPPPIENMETFWSPSEQYGVQQALSMSLVGDKAKVRHGLESILRETQADEIMVNGQIFDHQARLHSFDLAMDVKQELLGSRIVLPGGASLTGPTASSRPDKVQPPSGTITLLVHRQQIKARQNMDNRVADTEDQNQGNHRFTAPDAKFWAAETFARFTRQQRRHNGRPDSCS